MNLDRRGMLAALAASALAAGSPAFARAGRTESQAYATTQALIDGYVAQGLVPGAIVGIVKPGRHAPHWLTAGKTAFEGGTAVTPDTIWRIYSMTKPITGVTVMQQLAAGRLTLDTPVADIMPEFRQMRVLLDPSKGLESRPAVKPILVRHLLTHTAGFSYTISGDDALEKEYRRLGLMPMSSGLGRTPADAPTPDLTTYMQRLATLPLRTEPGAQWRYSVSMDVAGAMLERLTGKTLDRVFSDQLFQPLGMRDTGFWLDPARMKRLASLYVWVDPETGKPAATPTQVDSAAKSEWAARPTMLAGGAGLVSSAADYARFAQMMLNEGLFEGRRMLPQTVARLAMANQMERGVFYRDADGNGAGARAILSDPAASDSARYRVGSWGWGGAASTLFHVDPVRGQAVVLMLQSLGSSNGPDDSQLNRALAADCDR